MGKHQRSSSCRKGKKKVSQQSLISDSIQRTLVSSSCPNKFTKGQLEEQLLKTVTCLRLPFQIVEDTEFQRLLNLVRSGPQGVELPSAKTLRRRLREAVVTQQEIQLRDLPEDAKVSLALNCWTSPFQQAFMAITVYFIDKEWKHRELLLGFEPLHGPHSRVNLSDVLLQLLRERHLLSRIFSVTTDNATNNETLVRALQETLLSTGAICSRDSIIRAPCMAHVIQPCLKRLLGHIKAAPQNKEVTNQASQLDRLLIPPSTSQLSARGEYDEVDRYLREGTVQLPPRAYWKEHEHEYPVLSRLARDLLSVPATGAGVERLFNTARDICHYHLDHGDLNALEQQLEAVFKIDRQFDAMLRLGEIATFMEQRASYHDTQNPLVTIFLRKLE
ncbi:hypothetical protein CBS147353_11550 [Aspergillus niger]|nr:hypothetical protein CBS147353_11550 [Aspergillus niger]